MIAKTPTQPKFDKGEFVYYRNFHDFDNGERMWQNRVFFYVSFTKWDYEKGERYYLICEGCYIEESRLKRGDVLSRMIEDEED